MSMKVKQESLALTSLVGGALLLGSCAPGASNASIIATSVALTVQAQNTLQAQFTSTLPAVLPTLAPLVSPTAAATKAPPTAPPPGSGNVKPCYSAEYVADVTIPDYTIIAPGASFWKTWSVKNTGSCAWNANYKFVFVDGDVLGGAYVYPFPGIASPGQTVEIPIQLFAPQTTGTYTGNWKLQSPDKVIFGVSKYDIPLSVKIVVGSGTPQNNKTQTIYDVTAVSYKVERRCTGANTFWHIWVNLTSNGPIKIGFDIVQSDNVRQNNIRMTFTEATTQTFDYGEWSQRTVTSSPNARWVQAVTTSPTYHEWPHSEPLLLCGY
jgi:hypothetical protein